MTSDIYAKVRGKELEDEYNRQEDRKGRAAVYQKITDEGICTHCMGKMAAQGGSRCTECINREKCRREVMNAGDTCTVCGHRLKEHGNYCNKCWFLSQAAFYKRTAKERGVPFFSDRAKFVRHLQEMWPNSSECPVCDKEMLRNSASLDEVVYGSGYVEGNVWWICASCNQLKGTFSLDDLRWRRIIDKVGSVYK